MAAAENWNPRDSLHLIGGLYRTEMYDIVATRGRILEIDAVEAFSRAPKMGQMNRTRSRVLVAVEGLLGTGGFGLLTIEAVAAESGVARSTIYRHWSSLGDLVLDAVAEVLGPVAEPADTGNVRDDLLLLFEGWLAGLVSGPFGKLVPALVEASVQSDVFRRALEEGVVARRAPARVVLRRAIDRGELSPLTNPEWMLDSVVGPIYYRMLMAGSPIDEPGLVAYLIDGALNAAGFDPLSDVADGALVEFEAGEA